MWGKIRASQLSYLRQEAMLKIIKINRLNNNNNFNLNTSLLNLIKMFNINNNHNSNNSNKMQDNINYIINKIKYPQFKKLSNKFNK